MAVNVGDAEMYIAENVIDNEDWTDADDAKKQRILTVAQRTVVGLYPGYTIPDEAIYEYAAVLAIVFNDNGRLQRQGVSAFSLSGTASFNFAVTSAPSSDIARYMPKVSADLINADATNIANNLAKVGGRVKWTVI